MSNNGGAGRTPRGSRSASVNGPTTRRDAKAAALAASGSRPGRGSGRSGAKRSWWRAGWRAWLKRGAFGIAMVFALGLAATAYAFATVDVPDIPNATADAETSIVYYDDGKTEMARIAELDRVPVALSQVPVQVQHAVIAAEDRDFYTNNGISPQGIVRSIWSSIKGGEVAGSGSTITQQYVKNYFLTQDRTIDRKLKEWVISVKVDRDMSKDQILEGYLNTIYYGRGAYGIQTAAKAYFNKDVSQLTVGEGAVIASVLNAPSLYDPALGDKQLTNLRARFGYVLDGMVTMGWLTPAERAATTMPAIAPKGPSRALSGPSGYIVAAVRQELIDKLKLQSDDIDRGGLRITTTINAKAQAAAEAAVAKDFPKTGNIADVYAGLVAVRPGDGAVTALYGGADYQKRQLSSATDARMQAGSTFKAFALIAALQQGISTRTTFDGSSPMKDPALGAGTTVKNAGGVSYGTVDLRKATAQSINTAFLRLNIKMGPAATKAAAIQAGIPADTPGLDDNPTNVLGTASPRVIDLANAYATIAAQGKRATPYLISRVTSNATDIDYTVTPNLVDAISPDVTADTTDALAQVTRTGGTGARAAALGRPVAGKTGTTDKVMSVWFSGFSPDLAAAVGMYRDVNGTPGALSDLVGNDGAQGSAIPLTIWVDFMRGALEGTPKTDFPKRVGIGDDKVHTAGPSSTATSTSAPTDPPIPEPTTPVVPPEPTTPPTTAPVPTKTTGGGGGGKPTITPPPLG